MPGYLGNLFDVYFDLSAIAQFYLIDYWFGFLFTQHENKKTLVIHLSLIPLAALSPKYFSENNEKIVKIFSFRQASFYLSIL